MVVAWLSPLGCLQTGNIAALSQAIFGQVEKLQACRASGLSQPTLTAEQFLVRFVPSNVRPIDVECQCTGFLARVLIALPPTAVHSCPPPPPPPPPQPLYWLFSFTAGKNGPPQDFNLGFEGVDWMPANPNTAPNTYAHLFKMECPTSCSFSSALADTSGRTCKFSYTGAVTCLSLALQLQEDADSHVVLCEHCVGAELSKLFGGTLDLDVEVTMCPGDVHGWAPPNMGITASGGMYTALKDLYPCAGAGDNCAFKGM